LGYLITGRIDAARKELSRNPYAVRANFDRIIEEKTKRIQQYKEAVAGMIAQQEKKINKVKQLSNDLNKMETLKEGAAAKARSVVEENKAKGLSMEEIKSHEDYMKCLSAFNDFSHTIEEKSSHVTELEGDVTEIGSNIKNHKIQLQELLRDIDKLKDEASATVADMITAKEEENIANIIAGISEDRTSKELQEMRDLRVEGKAKARISRELAGTDTKQQEAEFLEYARANASTDEFDKLIGLADEADTESASAEDQEKLKTQLPEQ
jgi:phage shock protein A